MRPSCRRSIDFLDPKKKPGSGIIRTGSGSRALWLTEDAWHQKYENQKECLLNYLKFLFTSNLNIFRRLGYRALDLILAKTGSATLSDANLRALFRRLGASMSTVKVNQLLDQVQFFSKDLPIFAKTGEKFLQQAWLLII